jgi:hypothetical protein
MAVFFFGKFRVMKQQEEEKRFHFHLQHRFTQTRQATKIYQNEEKKRGFLSNIACDTINHHKAAIYSAKSIKYQKTAKKV